jgi:oligopeptide/dipeptide ABC transporter ATP-binding protein
MKQLLSARTVLSGSSQRRLPVAAVVSPEGAPRPPADALLEVEDLRVHFDGRRGVVRAVDGVSLTVRPGRSLGIVGESGSGKTVLIRSIMGLIDQTGAHREGHVRFSGVDLAELPPEELRKFWGRDIGMVFQNPMTSLNPVRRVGVQVAAPMRRHLGLSKRAARTAAVELLRSVGIADAESRVDVYPHELSGGMRQRVMIAIALACRPKLLLADEPTTALDVTVQKQVLELLDHQRAIHSTAMVLVTHDLGVVSAHTDDVAVMYAGRIVEQAPTRRLFSRVHMPYTEALMKSIPRLRAPSHTPLEAIPGRPPDLSLRRQGCSFAPRCPYATEQCRTTDPPLRAVPGAPEHLVACWYPLHTPMSRSAGQSGGPVEGREHAV